MRLDELNPGESFVIPGLQRRGLLVRLTPAAAEVRYENDGREVSIGQVTFHASGRVVTISRGTDIEPDIGL